LGNEKAEAFWEIKREGPLQRRKKHKKEKKKKKEERSVPKKKKRSCYSSMERETVEKRM